MFSLWRWSREPCLSVFNPVFLVDQPTGDLLLQLKKFPPPVSSYILYNQLRSELFSCVSGPDENVYPSWITNWSWCSVWLLWMLCSFSFCCDMSCEFVFEWTELCLWRRVTCWKQSASPKSGSGGKPSAFSSQKLPHQNEERTPDPH